MAKQLYEAATELMNKLTESGFKSDKKKLRVSPMLTLPTGFTNLQLGSIGTILLRDVDADSLSYNEKDRLRQRCVNNNRKLSGQSRKWSPGTHIQ